MMFLLLFAILAGTTAALWFQGLWRAALALVNLTLAMTIASNFFEPISTFIENKGAASYTYLLDFIVLWILFAITYAILRTITERVAKTPVKFDMPVEMAGRSVLALWCGWLMVCFVAFSLQMAPLNAVSPLGAWSSPASSSFAFVSPDRLWLGYLFSRSQGALAGGAQFDPKGEFPLKYHERRVEYSKGGTSLRAAR
jgi:hypothetical protein